MFPDSNYFASQTLIEDRLATELSDILTSNQIHAGFDLPRILAGTILYPALFVTYMQDDEIISAQHSVDEFVTQRWQITVGIRNVGERDAGQLMTEAGQLVLRVIRALKGWAPISGWAPLRRVPAERASYPDVGIGFFNIEFIIKTSLER